MTMDEKEIDEFLKNGRMLKIASIRDNKPHVTPIWYIYQNGKFYISTSSKTRKVKNLKKNNNVAFSLDVGEAFADVKAVVGSGTAQIVTDSKLAREVDMKIKIKYLGSTEHPIAKKLAELDDTVIEITPTEKISWDYSKY
jgi:nitroimidazol reductase NimA-like FMN-containing flavoprotein (pyridoxamine 5'-phosphate oxidase superfamily)